MFCARFVDDQKNKELSTWEMAVPNFVMRSRQRSGILREEKSSGVDTISFHSLPLCLPSAVVANSRKSYDCTQKTEPPLASARSPCNGLAAIIVHSQSEAFVRRRELKLWRCLFSQCAQDNEAGY